MERFVVREDRCIRCGACATLAPEVFALRPELLVLRQPAGKDEATRTMAALLNCPSQAIGVERQ